MKPRFELNKVRPKTPEPFDFNKPEENARELFLIKDSFATRGIKQEFTEVGERVPTGMINIVNDTAASDLSNTVTETTLKSKKLFFTPFIRSRAFVIKALGTYSTVSGTPTFTLRFKALEGGSSATTHHTITSTAGQVTDSPWSVEWIMTVPTVGTTGTIESHLEAKINNVNKDTGRTGALTFNTNAMQEFRITAQWSGADVNNVLKLRQFLIFLV